MVYFQRPITLFGESELMDAPHIFKHDQTRRPHLLHEVVYPIVFSASVSSQAVRRTSLMPGAHASFRPV